MGGLEHLKNASTSNADSSQRPLSHTQIRGAEILAVYGLVETYADVAARIGVTRETLYEWRQRADFQDMVLSIGREALKLDMPKIYRALSLKAQSGDVKAIELAMKVSGELAEKQAETDFAAYLETFMVHGDPEVIAVVMAKAGHHRPTMAGKTVRGPRVGFEELVDAHTQ